MSKENFDDFLNELDNNIHHAKYSIIDKKIMIGGQMGSGKTSLMNNINKILIEETGEKHIMKILMTEDRYSVYDEYHAYNIPLLDYYNENKELTNNVVSKNPKCYKNFLHLAYGVSRLANKKLEFPNLPIQVIGIDNLGTVVKYAMEHLLLSEFRRTKVMPTINTYGGKARGAIYTDTIKIIDDHIIRPLEAVGFTIHCIFHIKQKSFTDKMESEDYMAYAPEIASSVYLNIAKNFDYTVIFEDDSRIEDGSKLYGNKRTLRWRNGGGYTGLKSTASLDKIPETQDIFGMSDEDIAKLVVNTVVGSINKKGYTEEMIKKEIKEESDRIKNENIEMVNNLNNINSKKESIKKEAENRNIISTGIETILKSVDEKSKNGIETYLKSFLDGKSISEWVNSADIEVVNKVVMTLNGATSPLGLEPLPTL